MEHVEQERAVLYSMIQMLAVLIKNLGIAPGSCVRDRFRPIPDFRRLRKQ